jgi:hypothetical protein
MCQFEIGTWHIGLQHTERSIIVGLTELCRLTAKRNMPNGKWADPLLSQLTDSMIRRYPEDSGGTPGVKSIFQISKDV